MVSILLFLVLLSYREPDGYFLDPKVSFNGIIVTDNHCSAIYFIKGNDINELISAPGCGRYYSLSPDRKFIGFKLIDRDGLQAPVIYNLTTRTLTELYKSVPQAGQINFSNDGKISFTIGEILIIKDSSKINRYNLGVYANLAPISPDGKYVAYNDDEDQLWIFDLKTEEKTCFTSLDSKNPTARAGCFNPVWSPDGRYIVYSTLDGHIKVYELSGKETYNIGEGKDPDWSSDCQHIIYCLPEIDGHEITGSELYLSKYDGSEKIRLTFTPDIFEMNPELFDDKRKLIFHTYEKGEICVSKIIDNELKETEIIFKSVEPLKIHYYNLNPNFGLRDSIDVPYLHQVYDTPDWHDGHWSCAPTTAMMAIAYYRRLPYWDCWCSLPYGHTSHFGNYICALYNYREVTYSDTARDASNNLAWGGYGYMWYDGYSPYSRMVDYIDYHNLTTWSDNSPTWAETVAEVQAGYPYCMCVGLTASGHLILAVGQVLDWHTLIFNDPYGNKNTPGYPSYDGKYARYDWPGYNNGYENLNQVYWCRGARGNWEPVCDTIVDDLQFRYTGESYGFYMYTDPPSTMRYYRDNLSGFRGHMWWTYTTVSADTCYVTWTPNLPQSGDYEVFAYIPSINATANARYQINYSGGTQTVVINQTNYSDEWVSLGTYSFNTSGGYVYLDDATETQGQHIGFDAMKWSYQDPGIEEVSASSFVNSVKFRSNPVNGVMVLDVNLVSNRKFATSIYDATGRCVYEEAKAILNSGLHRIKIDVSYLPSGVYIIKTSIGFENIFNKCVVVQ